MLRRHVLVAEPFRLILGFIENLVQLARECRLRIGLLGVSVDLARDLFAQRRYTRAELLENRDDDTLILLEQGLQEMEIVDDGISVFSSGVDRLVQRLGGFDGKLLRVDHASSRSNVDASNVGQCGRLGKLHRQTCRCPAAVSTRGHLTKKHVLLKRNYFRLKIRFVPPGTGCPSTVITTR